MKISIQVAENFKKKAKPLLRKYPSLRIELKLLEQTLTKNPTFGTPMGGQVYKIRLAIKSKGRGKSGGARIITYLEIEFIGEETTSEQTVVNLISIYDKAEIATLTDSEIQKIISNL